MKPPIQLNVPADFHAAALREIGINAAASQAVAKGDSSHEKIRAEIEEAIRTGAAILVSPSWPSSQSSSDISAEISTMLTMLGAYLILNRAVTTRLIPPGHNHHQPPSTN